MPAKSGSQRRAAGLALAVKRGKVSGQKVSKGIREFAQASEGDLRDFARKPKQRASRFNQTTVS